MLHQLSLKKIAADEEAAKEIRNRGTVQASLRAAKITHTAALKRRAASKIQIHFRRTCREAIDAENDRMRAESVDAITGAYILSKQKQVTCVHWQHEVSSQLVSKYPVN